MSPERYLDEVAQQERRVAARQFRDALDSLVHFLGVASLPGRNFDYFTFRDFWATHHFANGDQS